jgi:hypothetical protein
MRRWWEKYGVREGDATDAFAPDQVGSGEYDELPLAEPARG